MVWGEATLTVEVEVLFFSATCRCSAVASSAAADGDPKFIDLIPDQATWANYCEGFAAEAA